MRLPLDSTQNRCRSIEQYRIFTKKDKLLCFAASFIISVRDSLHVCIFNGKAMLGYSLHMSERKVGNFIVVVVTYTLVNILFSYMFILELKTDVYDRNISR